MYGSYGSYGSYSSMSSTSSLEIPTSSYLYSPSNNTQCAFPSWPRRDSLSESQASTSFRATSFVSDDDLLDTFDDDTGSLASGSSSNTSSPAEPAPITESALLRFQQDTSFLVSEKERRRQQCAMQQQAFAPRENKKRRGSSKKHSSPSKAGKIGAIMTPIAE